MRCGGPGLCSECTADASRARAALAQPSPAQAEQAEAERPEFDESEREDMARIAFETAMANGISLDSFTFLSNSLAERYERIVGELRADRDSWAEQAEQRLADWDEMRKERDAALARVAELERQEPVALANRGLHAFWVKWTEAAAGLYGPGIKLYAAPVVQAQHSVPKEFIGRLSEFLAQRGATGKALLRELRALCAAAPGKEVGHE